MLRLVEGLVAEAEMLGRGCWGGEVDSLEYKARAELV